MKKYLFAALIIFTSLIGFSQQLAVQSNSKGLFLNHTITPKESFFSVGRMYGTAPKEIAAFNGLDMNNGLEVGQSIMIPLDATNFSQSAAKGVPVYYTVGQKEGLYRVSLKNNKVLMANLRKWNKLANDNIATGQKLVVGYLNVTEVPAAAIAKVEPTKTQETSSVNEQAKTDAAQPSVSVAERKQEPVVVQEQEVKTSAPSARQTAAGGAGYFQNQFELQNRKNSANKDQTLHTGVFKTASGWQDSKYYALMDNVEPGTIIKVINPSNNKSIYAKILGEMSGIRQNQGLELRLSNAAASALEVNETDKFMVRVNY